MRVRSASLIPAVLFALPLTACLTPSRGAVAVDTRPGVSATRAVASDAAIELRVDSAAGRLAELEVRRVALRAQYRDWAPEVRAVDEQIAALENQL